MSRWISWVRPDTFPRTDSRGIRSEDDRGSMPYSAVTQPLPFPFSQGGTRSSTVAAQMTFVRHGDLVYRLTVLSIADSGARYRGRGRAFAHSFRPIEDDSIYSLKVTRLRIARALENETIQELSERTRNELEVVYTGVLNGLYASTPLAHRTPIKIGIASTLGARGKDVPPARLAQLLGDKDPAVARSGALALGSIGTAEAANVLGAAKSDDAGVKSAIADGLLKCAENLLAAGNKAGAKSAYEKIMAAGASEAAKTAAASEQAAAEANKTATCSSARVILMTDGEASHGLGAFKSSCVHGGRDAVDDRLATRAHRALAGVL